jgi:hypothetical protein
MKKGPETARRKTMRTMFLAAAVALTLGIGSAFAQESPSASGYVYPDFWGTSQVAPRGHSVTQSNGNSVGTYATHTENNGTWLFPPNPLGGGG